jgi:hypothetical protein
MMVQLNGSQGRSLDLAAWAARVAATTKACCGESSTIHTMVKVKRMPWDIAVTLYLFE